MEERMNEGIKEIKECIQKHYVIHLKGYIKELFDEGETK